MIRCLWRVFFVGCLLQAGVAKGFCQQYSSPPETVKFFNQLNKKERVNLPFGLSWREHSIGIAASRAGRNGKAWGYVPPFQHHLADYIFAHQNDVGLLYLYLQEAPSLLQSTSSPLPLPKPKLPSKYTADAQPPLITMGKPSHPLQTPVPFGQAMSQAKQSFQAQQYIQAAEQFEAAALSQPENPVVYAGLMFSYLANGDHAPAAAMLHRALALHEVWYKIPISSSLFYDKTAEFLSSVQLLENYAGEHPQDWEAHFLLGYAYFIQGNKQKMIEVLEAIIQAKPEYMEVEKLRNQIQH